MAPPAINLGGIASPFPFSSSKIHLDNNNTPSSRSSEEEREENTDGAVDEFNAAPTVTATANTAPTGKRPRGRPPGSKNKAKAPTYLSVDPQDSLRSHVMEVASGADISSSLSSYARSRGRGLAVLHAIGSVADITIRNSSSNNNNNNNSSSPPLFLKGKMDIISLSGTILPDNNNGSLSPAGLTVFVSGPHGQVLGGPLEGRLVADGAVMVMAATFATATYEKLPLQQVAGREDQYMGPDPGQGPGLDPGMEDPRYHHHAAAGFNMESSYAWFVHQQQNNGNGRALYME